MLDPSPCLQDTRKLWSLIFRLIIQTIARHSYSPCPGLADSTSHSIQPVCPWHDSTKQAHVAQLCLPIETTFTRPRTTSVGYKKGVRRTSMIPTSTTPRTRYLLDHNSSLSTTLLRGQHFLWSKSNQDKAHRLHHLSALPPLPGVAGDLRAPSHGFLFRE
jgi:hypothetical protein